jgi:heme-binding protein
MKRAFYILLLIIIVVQFFQPELPEVSLSNPNDLIASNKEIPAEIQDILRNSCYDCHSNETEYPWYSYVSPVSFLISRDTRVGRTELNFSNWEELNKIEKAGAIDDITEVISEGEMPMVIYTFVHKDTKLDQNDKELFINWFNDYAEKLFE